MRYDQLAAILEERFQIGPLAAPVIAILWATERLAKEVGVPEAHKQLSALNRKRERAGKMPAYFPGNLSVTRE